MKIIVRQDEAARLKALRRYQLLDTDVEEAFDDVTRLAATICNVPIALITLVDENRQWFKSKVGLDRSETPREEAFCAHTIQEGVTMVVEDAILDERFAQNPLVTGEPGIRFYAGTPLLTPDGFGLGSLCVIDRKPRQLTADQATALEALGRMVVAQMELRRVSRELAEFAGNDTAVKSLLPICKFCRSIRDDAGEWLEVESFLKQHTSVQLSRRLCPKCATEKFPAIFPAVTVPGL